MGTRSSSSRGQEANENNTNENGVAPSEEEGTPSENAEPQLSYWQMIKLGYQELVNAIIRPPRCEYEISQLGPKTFHFCGKLFIRRDFTLHNARGLAFVCSMWEPAQRPNPILPCVIYMHGNSSARLEAISQLSLVLALGATIITFDFTGSGLSEGDYVSLGYFEKDDLQAVIEYLRETGTTSTIALWGRSMGATTALLHGERDPSIAGMVLDSAFADLQQLAEEMVEKGRQQGLTVPSFIVRIAIRWIRSSVQKAAGFDIRELSPIQHADKCFIPALFVAADGDDFIPPHHSHQIHDRYAGDKNMIIVDGDHNSMRPKFMYDSVAIFFATTLQIPVQWMLEDGQRFISQPPWLADHRHAASTNDLNGIDVTDMNEFSIDQMLAASMLDIGMTTDRQQDIRQALYTMLGDRTIAARQTTTPASNTAITATASSSSSTQSSSHNTQLSSTSNTTSTMTSRKGGGEIPSSSSSSSSTATTTAAITAALAAGGIPLLATEWTCTYCTLMNVGDSDDCIACGRFRSG